MTAYNHIEHGEQKLKANDNQPQTSVQHHATLLQIALKEGREANRQFLDWCNQGESK